RARQLQCIPNRRSGNPTRRQRSRPLQSVHPFGIELVAFVHTAHHQFRQPCINQLWFSSSLLNLIHYPIPVPHRLHRHRRLSFPPANKVLNAPMSVLQSTLVQLFSLCILYPCPGVLLVNIQCDVFHNCSPPRSLIVTTAVTEYLAFILIRMTPAKNVILNEVKISPMTVAEISCLLIIFTDTILPAGPGYRSPAGHPRSPCAPWESARQCRGLHQDLWPR